MNNIISEAIKNKQVLEFTYDGENRVVEPYTLGVSKKSNDTLSGYQIGGQSVSSKDLGWRLFTIEKINNIRLTEKYFDGLRPDYNPNDSRMIHIYTTV